LYAFIEFRIKPFQLETENVFDFLATVMILLTFAESFWAENFVFMLNSAIPPGFYVVLVLNIGFLVTLIVAVAWPLIRDFLQWFKGRLRPRAVELLTKRSRSCNEKKMLHAIL
jgi:hypothetical protein